MRTGPRAQQLQDVSTTVVLGRTTAGEGKVENLTPAQARTVLGLGTAAVLNVGTGVNNIVQVDGDGGLPVLDGSKLTGIAGGSGDVTKAQLAARVMIGL